MRTCKVLSRNMQVTDGWGNLLPSLGAGGCLLACKVGYLMSVLCRNAKQTLGCNSRKKQRCIRIDLGRHPA